MLEHINLTPLDRVQTVVDECPNDEQDFYAFLIQQDPIWERLLAPIQSWARSAFGAAGSLRHRGELDRLDIEGGGIEADPAVQAALLKHEVALRVLEEAIVSVGASRMWSARKRIPDLLDCLVTGGLSAPAEDYLYRVAQLYLWGFDEQVFIMARSVLEAALKDKLSPSETYARLRDPDPPRERNGELREPSLEQRIKAAKQAPALYDKPTITEMYRIKDDGNVVVHVAASPSVTRSGTPLEAIRVLRHVLSVMYPS